MTTSKNTGYNFDIIHPASIEINNNNEKEEVIQYGGLYLKNVNKKGFKPILDMINYPDSTIKLLTYDSLKGFMIVLNVNEENSEYNYLSETSPRKFTKPVTEYLLKLAIITKKEKSLGRIGNKSINTITGIINMIAGINDGGILKYSETMDSFIEEAKIQQKIWYTSLSNGKDQLCPSIANFSTFTNKNSRELINVLQNKTNDDVLRHILNWMNQLLEKDASDIELGIITMPLIQNSSTFYKYLESYENGNVSQRDFLSAIELFLIQISRLWLDHRIYHADLHTNNSLIYKTENGEIKCVLIDFGRIIDFNTFIKKYKDEDGLTSDLFVSINEQINKKINELGFKLLASEAANESEAAMTSTQKIDGIEKLYKDIYNFDSMYYKQVYGIIHGNSYDYYNTIMSLKPDLKNEVFERVYNKLYEMYGKNNIVGKDEQSIDFFIKNKKRFFLVEPKPKNKYYYTLKKERGNNKEEKKKRKKKLARRTIKKKNMKK